MESIKENIENVKENIENIKENLKEKIEAKIPYSANKYISGTKDFLSSNSLIAKATFLIFIIIIFVLLFVLGTNIIKKIIEPPDNPYLIKGMISNQSMTINQSLSNPSSKLIKRSTNEYGGIEFTYSVWLFINEISNLPEIEYTHIFSKGANNNNISNGILQPSNSPGFYLFKGKHKPESDDLFKKSGEKVYSGVVIVNVYNKSISEVIPGKDNFSHEDRVYITGIPIKKWVNIIIRTNNQNLLDIYVNGVLNKRHKLQNVIRQNYDPVYVNYGNRLDGNISNLRYYNHAIGTFEIDRIMKSGPDLTTKSSDLLNINSDYISRDWFYPQDFDSDSYI